MPPDPDMLAAVTAAVGGVSSAAPVDPPADPPAAQEPEARRDLLGDDTPADPPAAAGDTPADPPATPEPDEHGRVRGPDGKFVAKDPADPAAAAKPADTPAAPPAPPKIADPVNDPAPPNAKPETRERITTLAGMVKEKDTVLAAKETELGAVRADLDLLLVPIREAGVELPQFNEAMQLLKNINSPHQHDQMKALQYLQGAAALLAEQLGQVPPGVDPLQGHDDLIQVVRGNPALRAQMEEVAKARRLTAATQQHQQTAQQREQQSQVHTREVQEAQAAVREVEQGFEAIDPQYKAKIAVLRADTAFVTSLRSMPPKQWPVEFAKKYRTIKVAVSAAPPPPPAPSNTPLRPKQPAGTAARLPATALEAVRGALKMG